MSPGYDRVVDEPLPGVWHWTAAHPNIGSRVHCHYAVAARTLFDPLVPDEGLEVFEAHGPPERVVLSNRHHLRHAERFADAFGCTLHCNRAGLHEFEGGPRVEGFDPGDELAPGIVAREVGVLCPDETALHIDAGPGALLFADGVIRSGEALEFVPDFLIGDDPEGVKAGLRAAFGRLAEADDFDALLFAHGRPLPTGGRAALRDFSAG
jgi:hypothetical protein